MSRIRSGTAFRGLSLVAASLLLAGATCAHAQTNNFVLLDPLLGGSSSSATAINNAGVVVGSSNTGVPGTQHATRWDSSGMAIDLDPLGKLSQATAINSADVAVGYTDSALTGNLQHATVWTASGAATDLGTLPPTAPYYSPNSSFAYGINNAGVVAGFSTTTGYNTGYRPLVWNGTTATDLGGANQSLATAINNAGAAAGWSYVDATVHATLWSSVGTATDLGAPGGLDSQALGINDAGVVVGFIGGAGYLRAAAWYAPDTAIDLGTLGGTQSSAAAINDAGAVVGYSFTAGNLAEHATLWRGASIVDLNSVLNASDVAAGWVLVSATGINDSGEIVGSAHNTVSGAFRAFELSVAPVPEPSTWVLTALGLVGLALQVRRGCTVSA